MYVSKNYTVMTCDCMQLAGVEGQMDSKFCSLGEGGTDDKDLPICTCVCGSAGAWLMAV